MYINEIFKSLQGESSFAGLPCVFIRLTGCNLRCSWCDTQYAFNEGTEIDLEEVYRKALKFDTKIIEITGGEPLLQKEAVITLSKKLLSKDKIVLLETNGSILLSDLPEKMIKIVDIKLPGSKEENSFKYENLKYLNKSDEIKFVLKDQLDYDVMKQIILKYDLNKICNILVSLVGDVEFDRKYIADQIINDNLNVRFQIQLHKIIWNDERCK